jgi:hypothetical protein
MVTDASVYRRSRTSDQIQQTRIDGKASADTSIAARVSD